VRACVRVYIKHDGLSSPHVETHWLRSGCPDCLLPWQPIRGRFLFGEEEEKKKKEEEVEEQERKR